MYPYAFDQRGAVVAADEAPRGSSYHCIGCGQPMVLRRGKVRRAHFAHAGSAGHCSPETVLHQLAKEAIKRGIEQALSEQRPYPLEWRCRLCDRSNTGNLAITPRRVEVESRFNGIRPDLLLTTPEGKPLAAIEVVVLHEPEDNTLQVYAQAGLPVVLVKPVWEDLPRLEKGLTGVEVQVLNGPCRSPLHPPPSVPPPLCPECHAPMRQVRIDVWNGYRCYRCGHPMPVLDVESTGRDGSSPDLIPSDTGDELEDDMALLALWESPPGLAGPARELGVRMREEYSQTAGTHYLMHLCPHCGAKQGDWYIHGERFADWIPVPEHPVKVGFYWWCRNCDRWVRQEIRLWKD